MLSADRQAFAALVDGVPNMSPAELAQFVERFEPILRFDEAGRILQVRGCTPGTVVAQYGLSQRQAAALAAPGV